MRIVCFIDHTQTIGGAHNQMLSHEMWFDLTGNSQQSIAFPLPSLRSLVSGASGARSRSWIWASSHDHNIPSQLTVPPRLGIKIYRVTKFAIVAQTRSEPHDSCAKPSHEGIHAKPIFVSLPTPKSHPLMATTQGEHRRATIGGGSAGNVHYYDFSFRPTLERCCRQN